MEIQNNAIPTSTPFENNVSANAAFSTTERQGNAPSGVRTRFAPSPTGFLHIGGVRTALFAWLIAKQNNGQFVLRIEDTDKAREVEGSVQQIQDTLSWLGLDWDFGPENPGEFGSCLQSMRLQHYYNWGRKLIDRGLAYADPYTTEQLESFRAEAIANKKPFLYRDYRPENPPIWDGSQPLRLLVKEPKAYSWHDEVRGDLSAGPEALDDFILIKTDGYPTYNFAHIVDDAEMGITHIVRADEFIASTPRFLSLYEALEITPPKFVTVPPILGPTGSKKLSKRDGAKDVLEYRDEGYLQSTVINFLALLGWNPGTEQEMFTVLQLIETFDVARIQSSGARFDPKRIEWLNGMHIRAMNTDELYDKVADYWHPASANFPIEFKKSVLELVKERMKTLNELSDISWFFFKDPTPDEALATLTLEETKLSRERALVLLAASIEVCRENNFTVQGLHDAFYALSEKEQSTPSELFKLLRIVMVGGTTAPGLFETMHLLGSQTTLRRLETAQTLFGNSVS
jgi:glutamyl-tRNA synthetase